MTLPEWMAEAEREALHGAKKLHEAKIKKDLRAIGYWTAYVEAQEDIILILSGLSETD